ncbi:beta-soluble NSF attachment protein isoform X3 [Loxodonta africana]|nr:beta-soluble NSF attachment protein isoform X1 [Loxodonta africana]XP_023405727.1 beta-soluble NSF attachment protein isoform X1 [Loxodonta africana]XP_023405728.1 beta-soluble NSF attachment protein isoform X1 [Loxodonta africana]
MYTRAANMFKMAKNWSGILVIGNQGTEWLCNLLKVAQQVSGGAKNRTQAGWFQSLQCFLLSDETSENQLREMHFVKQPSSICSFRANTILPLALWMPGTLIKRQTRKGRFSIAAKHHITIAEIYETELVDIEKAIAHYEQSADYYKGEESNSSANKCLLKVAAYAAQLEQYQKAIEIYEQVGTNTMDNPLLKYSAKDYFFKAALCHFIVDELNAKLALEKYEEMFPAFTDSRECKLLKKLLEAHEEQNSEAYTEAVKEFDSISRLDQWLTTMLLRIKKSIQGDGEGDGDLK